MKTTDSQLVLLDANATGAFATALEQAHALTTSEISRQVAMTSSFWDERFSWVRPYAVSSDGILTIPVKGSLMHDFPYQLGSWATGYEYINEALVRGINDPGVRGIALEINSPGGYVSGNFDLVDRIAAMREIKPIHAFVNETACSAAYNIAAACKSISVPRTGSIGSIGVLRVHMDYSGFMEGRGIKTTFIHAGKHKVDGNYLEPLPDSVKERWQAEVESTYSDFVATVARNRGMEESAIRDTQAQVYQSTEALETGLVDKIGPHPESLVAYATLFNSVSQQETDEMADKAEVTQAAMEAAVASAKAEGVKEGAVAERNRITSILNSDEAKERPKAALASALKTEMDADAAKAFLADMPKEAAAQEHTQQTAGAGAKTFNAAMDATGNPKLGLGSGTGEEMTAEQKMQQRVARALGKDSK